METYNMEFLTKIQNYGCSVDGAHSLIMSRKRLSIHITGLSRSFWTLQ